MTKTGILIISLILISMIAPAVSAHDLYFDVAYHYACINDCWETMVDKEELTIAMDDYFAQYGRFTPDHPIINQTELLKIMDYYFCQCGWYN